MSVIVHPKETENFLSRKESLAKFVPYSLVDVEGKTRNFSYGATVIFCRTKKVALKLYLEYFGHSFNPNNLKKGIVYDKGYLEIPEMGIKEAYDFWKRFGYYPMLRNSYFWKKKRYNKVTSNAVRFIESIK